MSNVKRKFKRIHKVVFKMPRVECFCDCEGILVKIYYDGEVSSKRLPGNFLSQDDVACMERDILNAFEDIPWYDMTGLMNIVEWMLEDSLVPSIEISWPR
ncbi:hypothetical protein ES703_15284 [subsurface metagenome]